MMRQTGSDDIALFTAALAMPAAERGAFVAKVCIDDDERGRLIVELLKAHDTSEGFLERPLVDSAAPAEPRSEYDVGPGDRVGCYSLAHKIGEGGCGVVYLAQQTEPVPRQVAIKIIKAGMATSAVVARFEAERKALSRMDHPNIARVLDAGATVAGRPFFVMELVRGIAITEYCDLHRLPLAERLRLVALVCRAIEHAHQKGIIHRDLKPSNILVTLQDGEPVPKVIDFGVAKATQGRLADQTLFTAVDQFVGTPAYMSPEQADTGDFDVDTRTDIYSLGVLLYELLTGSTPFAAKNLRGAVDQVRRAIRETDPPLASIRIATLDQPDALAVANRRRASPAQLRAQVRGDLDWIVAKAIEKDRDRRYETVSALASDLRRHQQSEPILARPPTVSYRLKKLFARHKVPVLAAVAVSIALLSAATLSTWRYWQERAARERAVAAENAEARERTRAEQARLIAEEARREAESARRAAEVQRVTAEGAQHAAEVDRGVAEQVKREAERARAAAEDAQHLAETSHRTAVAAADELKANLYAADMYAAQNLLRQKGDFSLVQRILRNHVPRPGEPDLRGVEWSYAWKLSQGDKLFSWRAEQGVVRDIVFSPNGRMLASAGRGEPGEQGQVRVWDPLSHRLLAAFIDTECVGFSADSRTLLTATRDGRVQLWRTETWTQLGEFSIGDVAPIANQRVEMVVAPVGSLLALCADGAYGQRKGTVLVLDWAKRRLVARLEDAGCRMVFGADGKTLVTGSSADYMIKIWDAEAGQLQKQFGPLGFVASLAISPDGSRLMALIAGKKGSIRLWKFPNLQPLRTLAAGELDPLPGAVAFSPDGELIASGGGDKLLRVWRVSTGRPVGEMKGSAGAIWALAFSPDGERVYTGGRAEEISVWAAAVPPQANETTITTLAPGRADMNEISLRFSPDGSHFVAAEWERMILCDTREARIVAKRSGHHVPLWFADDGTHLLSINQQRRTARRDELIAIPAGQPGGSKADAVYEFLELLRVPEWVIERSTPLVPPAGNGIGVATASRNGQYVAVSWRGHPDVFVYDTATGAVVRRIAPRSASVLALAFSPDSRALVLGGSSIYLEAWDLVGHDAPWIVAAHKSNITQIAFSADGRMLATCSLDRVQKFWHWPERREIGQMGGFDPASQVEFSPDGKSFWVDTGAVLKLWDVRTQRDLGAFPLTGKAGCFALSPNQRALVYCDETGDERQLVLVRIADRSALVAPLAAEDQPAAPPVFRLRVPGAKESFASDTEVEPSEATRENISAP
jgi:serine/threonine protein kinase/WD40 repeat protein